MGSAGQQAFAAAVAAEFPGLQEALGGAGSALGAAVDVFAQFTQGAKDRGDWPTYERCVALADRLYAAGDGELVSAFRSSFFEHLAFEGSRGPAAWQLLTPALQAAWKQMDAENRRLMALPQAPRRSVTGDGRSAWSGTPKPPRGRDGPKGPKGPRGPRGSRGPKGRGGHRGGRGGPR